MKQLFLLILLLKCVLAIGQTTLIRGQVTDKVTERPLAGASVEIVGISSAASISDSNGNYRLSNVPLGRQVLRVSFIGYETSLIPNIDISTGKDVIIQVALSESYNKLEEVLVKSKSTKYQVVNKMAAVSARQFSVEQVGRYSGGRSDVARLATNFAGVSAPDDSRNDIVIRGNSPSGLLWRIEGIPVPSPNHFSSLGTTGSPVSAINPNVLTNSDFITSAFPAEYGNALSGVFDLQFRKGNKQHNEYTVGVGAFTGLEAMAEGPLGKKGGSFVVSGRNAIAGLLGSAGGTTAPPNYNDLSLNVDFGKTKWGNFSVFAIAGNARIEFIGDKVKENDLFALKDEDAKVKSGFGVLGVKHQVNIGSNAYIKTVIGSSFSANTVDNFRYFNKQTAQEIKLPNITIDNKSNRNTVSSFLNVKFSKKANFRTGLLLELFSAKASLATRESQPDNNGDGYPDYNNILSNNGNFAILQPFAQAQLRLTEKLTLNTGLHAQYFSLNKKTVLEPRLSFSWSINSNSNISVGYGLHHQNIAEPLLFLNELINGVLLQTNRKLDLVRARHYVVGYEAGLGNNWRAKTELYFQKIDKAAVQASLSGYSSLTEGSAFIFSTDKTSLVNKGTGFNRGVEFTLEKYYSKGYHALLTTSVFDSKYKGSDGIERNTPFNNKFVLNLLGGKEFKIGKRKKNVFSADTKLTTAGGRFYTPIDLAASNAAGFEVKAIGQEFSKQYKNYFRLDIKFGMKFNSHSKKQFHQFYIDLQNVTNNQNIFIFNYNREAKKIVQVNQIGFFPDFGYRFQF
jgi:CarboxypepD_reg-like domain/TonB dependent receptor/TonB-dependent Receptor Plug Domain